MDEKTETDSKSHFKIILQKSSWYFLSSILTKAITIFLLPITTRYLNKSDFGILSNLDAINQLLPLFMSLLLDSAYYRFYFHYKDDHKKLKTYVSTYFWSILILGTIVFFLSVFIGGMFVTKLLEVPFYPVIPLTMISPLILQLSALGNSYTKQLLKSELNSVIVIGSYLIYIGVFVFLLVNKGLGYQAKLYALIVSNLLQFISFNYLLLKNNLIGFKFDKNILIEGLKYSLPLLPNTCSGWITSLSDRILITIFKNVEDSGVYSIGYMLGQGLTMFTGAIFNVYTPLMFSMLVKKKDESLKRIERFIPFYFFIMFWIAFVLGFFSKEAIYLLTDYKYHMAYMVTPIVAYAYFFGAMYKPFVNLIFFQKKTWIISTGAVFASVSNIGFNIIFIPIFGQLAAAWTTFFSLLVYFLWLYFWSQSMDKLRIEWKKIILTLIIGVFTAIPYLIIDRLIGLNMLFGISLKIILLILAMIFSFVFGIIKFEYFKFKKD